MPFSFQDRKAAEQALKRLEANSVWELSKPTLDRIPNPRWNPDWRTSRRNRHGTCPMPLPPRIPNPRRNCGWEKHGQGMMKALAHAFTMASSSSDLESEAEVAWDTSHACSSVKSSHRTSTSDLEPECRASPNWSSSSDLESEAGISEAGFHFLAYASARARPREPLCESPSGWVAGELQSPSARAFPREPHPREPLGLFFVAPCPIGVPPRIWNPRRSNLAYSCRE